MLFAIVDIDIAKEILPNSWEYARKSNDGSQVIIHKEIVDKFRESMGLILTLSEEEPPYPFLLKTGDEINLMIEFKSNEELI